MIGVVINMKKRHITNLIIINIIMLLIILSLTNNTALYISKHYLEDLYIIDNLRTLFDKSKIILPNLLFNLNNGVNIFNISYIGILSPFIVISYILSFIPTYIIIPLISIISLIVDSILIYKYLINHKYNTNTSFIVTLILIICTSIMYYSHYDINNILYLPFLLLSFYGLDKKIKNNKGWLLTLSLFLMILTNYYLSIYGIIAIIIYTFYLYLKKFNIITIKSLVTYLNKIAIPIIVALLLSSIVIVPSIYTIINNDIVINTSYLKPNIYILLIILLSIVLNMNYKKETIFLNASLIIILLLSYVLKYNIIPFIILFIIPISNIFNKLSNKPIYILIIVFSICYSYVYNQDNLILKKQFIEEYKTIKEATSLINYSDDSPYHVSVQSNSIDDYLNTNKYVLSYDKEEIGYEKFNEVNNLNIYYNPNIIPIGRATSSIMSYEDYEKLSDISKKEVLLSTIVVDEPSNNNVIFNNHKIDVDYNKILKDYRIHNYQDKYTIKANDSFQVKHKIPSKYRNNILFIKFNITELNNKYIKINNKINYLDNNEQLFILDSKEQKSITITFPQGVYTISNIEIYALDSSIIETSTNNFSKLNIEETNVDKSYIKGTISLVNDGYLATNIPYDEGFIVRIDGEVTNYNNVNNGYIGVNLKQGIHEVEFIYISPFKDLSALMSLLGLINLLLISYLESQRKI